VVDLGRIGPVSRRFIIVPVGIVAVAAIYWFLSGDMAGTTLLGIFGIAVAVYGAILLPSVNDVGPTAPVDPDWEPGQHRD